MMTYLLKSSLSLLLLLLFYKTVLESRRMHRFNRVYLLGSLLFSALVPGLSFELWPADSSLPIFPLEPGSAYGPIVPLASSGTLPVESATGVGYGWWIYGIVTAVMLTRFVLNLLTIIRRIADHPKQSHRGATLVLLDEDVLPHTFLRYLFLSGPAYHRGDIEDELLTHELAHVRQGHTFDVLFVELLLCFGWFNPLLFGYKRAIQLNHEFLADEAVIRTHSGVARYQRLLLSKLAPAPAVALTSSLTFQTTKQRLLMMTKYTSQTSTWLAGTTATLLLVVLTVLLGTTSTAQVTPPTGKQTPVTKRPQPKTDVAEMERVYGDKLVIFPGRNAPRRKFSELSASEKRLVQRIPPLPRQVPTEAQMKEWKNAKKFGIWLDEKRVPNSRLNDYAPQDFGSYFLSKLEKNAINYGKHYFQVGLMTKPAYEKYLEEDAKNPMLMLRDRQPKAK